MSEKKYKVKVIDVESSAIYPEEFTWEETEYYRNRPYEFSVYEVIRKTI